jgi:polysaccharide export outer membrane protein
VLGGPPATVRLLYDRDHMRFFLAFSNSSGFRTIAPALVGAISLSACATLPSSGPTGHQIQRSVAETNGSDGAIRLLELTDVKSLPPAPGHTVSALPTLTPPPTDMIGPGDILEIAIYESGVPLFGAAARISGDAPSFDSSAKVEKLSGNRVDDNGDILVPYAGRLHVAGRTPAQVETQIRSALKGLSQNPQVLVSISQTITNSVIVAGEVGKPGRLVLPTNRETVSDAVALAGGYRGEAKDLAVRLQRSGVTDEFRLSDAINGDRETLRLYPGDRLSLLRLPRSFSVMGAPGRVELFPFASTDISLAEAVAQAGGANPGFGDPEAIFVFRYVADPDGTTHPVVYHIDMMKAGSYFLSQRFAMRDKDLLYIGNARANQPSKLVQIISQLFSPIVTATSAAQALR